jgi:hypothetical protein
MLRAHRSSEVTAGLHPIEDTPEHAASRTSERKNVLSIRASRKPLARAGLINTAVSQDPDIGNRTTSSRIPLSPRRQRRRSSPTNAPLSEQPRSPTRIPRKPIHQPSLSSHALLYSTIRWAVEDNVVSHTLKVTPSLSSEGTSPSTSYCFAAVMYEDI